MGKKINGNKTSLCHPCMLDKSLPSASYVKYVNALYSLPVLKTSTFFKKNPCSHNIEKDRQSRIQKVRVYFNRKMS